MSEVGPLQVDELTGYLHVPHSYSLIPGVKPWVSLRHSTGHAGYLGHLGKAAQQNPYELLAFLRGTRSAQQIGEETVGTDDTLHFRFDVDLKAARAASPAKQSGLLNELASSAVDSLVIDLWMDRHRRARKVTYEFDLAKPGGSHGVDLVNVAVEYFDFGVPVNVSAPPADQVGSYLPGLYPVGGQR